MINQPQKLVLTIGEMSKYRLRFNGRVLCFYAPGYQEAVTMLARWVTNKYRREFKPDDRVEIYADGVWLVVT
jgi:hypothetical protein